MTKIMVPSWGWVYLHVVLDWYSKKIVGYNLSCRSKAQDWREALALSVGAAVWLLTSCARFIREDRKIIGSLWKKGGTELTGCSLSAEIPGARPSSTAFRSWGYVRNVR